VVVGAHLDSMHGAQGATDNAAGCSAVIEALRSIVAAGAAPARTIRVALWGGEEQGRRGSKAYVQAHRADRTVVYFNIDRGAGRASGMTLEGNEAARVLVEQWTFSMPGVRQVVTGTTGGSDHVSFREAGIPSLTFIQEPRSYGTTHHSTGDVAAAIREDELRQAAASVAVAAYLAATGQRLPQ
jgi:Zn-dependent M28 family amino/carboxypeptidase